MKNGIELIADERLEQMEKHGRTIEQDVALNGFSQLSEAASKLSFKDIDDIHGIEDPPKGWDFDIWNKMINKPYKERLIIAGALIAAEIDRIQVIDK